jgi:hypothetical protein
VQNNQQHINSKVAIVADNWSVLPFFEEDSGFSEYFVEQQRAPRKMPVTPQQQATVPLYSGATDVELYIAALERAATLYGWDDAETCTAAKTRLAGAGEMFLESLRKQRIECVVWLDRAANAGANPAVLQQTGMRERLRGRFGEIITEIAAADAVTNLQQKAGESVSEFHDRCVVAVDRMNHTYTEQQKQAPGYQVHFTSLLFTFLASGIREEIRSRTLGAPNPPRTADALLTAAKSVESEVARSKKQKVVLEVAQCRQSQQGNDDGGNRFPTSIEELRDMMAVMIAGGENAAITRQVGAGQGRASGTVSKEVICYNCGGKGHLALKCPSPKGTSRRSREQTGYGHGSDQGWHASGHPRGRGRGGFSHEGFGHGAYYSPRGGYGQAHYSPRGGYGNVYG